MRAGHNEDDLLHSLSSSSSSHGDVAEGMSMTSHTNANMDLG